MISKIDFVISKNRFSDITQQNEKVISHKINFVISHSRFSDMDVNRFCYMNKIDMLLRYHGLVISHTILPQYHLFILSYLVTTLN